MSLNFFNIGVRPELICEFLAVFSRVEYSLKETIIYASGDSNVVNASWDTFANDIDEIFLSVDNLKLKQAIKYLLENPPKKQVLENGELLFKESEIDNNQKKTQQVLLMVRRVRNNLFHGGKYGVNNDRDEKLIEYSLKVLTECVKIKSNVFSFYKS